MAAPVQDVGNTMQLSRHSRRLEELRMAAAEIRQRHVDGKITALEAAAELDNLTKRYSSFLLRLLEL